jgi:hypothetical protein
VGIAGQAYHAARGQQVHDSDTLRQNGAMARRGATSPREALDER